MKKRAAPAPRNEADEARAKHKALMLQHLDALTRAVQSDEVAGIAVSFVLTKEPFTGSRIAVDTVPNAKLLTAALMETQHEWQHSLRGR